MRALVDVERAFGVVAAALLAGAFSNAQPIYFRPFDVADAGDAAADGYRSTAIRDLDGSLTGMPDRTMVYQSPVLSLGCASLHGANAAVCAGRYGSLFILDDPPGGTAIGPIRIAAVDAVDAAEAPSIVLAGNPRRTVCGRTCKRTCRAVVDTPSPFSAASPRAWGSRSMGSMTATPSG